ncbi:MAG: hypothetical protein ACXVTC_22635 [Solirubrobacteraceae bacterium]
MVRRALLVVAVTAAVAGVIVAAAVMANGPRGQVATSRPTRAVQHAPNIQVPSFGYSCEVASGTGCSLHPCVKYAQSLASPPADVAVVTSAAADRCSSTAKATPRAIPIVGP